MELCTISQLTRMHGVSTRTLRYYEQMGLIESIRPPDYAYRMYDELNAMRVGQIVLLRKLRVPISDIAPLLKNKDVAGAIDVFSQRIREIEAEMVALETLRDMLRELIERLNQVRSARLREYALSDKTVLAIMKAVTDEPYREKGVRTLEKLDQVNEEIGRLKDVRIVYLPPATVAASHFVGDEPENVANDQMLQFALDAGIAQLKPDVRVYGFNHPNPVDETGAHGYEFWLTIPDDLPVLPPLVKKTFDGGLYAAHMIKIGDFHEWAWLDRWVRESAEYEYRGGGSPENMFDSLEEHLNAYTHLRDGEMNSADMQLDLLIPVRRKKA